MQIPQRISKNNKSLFGANHRQNTPLSNPNSDMFNNQSSPRHSPEFPNAKTAIDKLVQFHYKIDGILVKVNNMQVNDIQVIKNSGLFENAN